MYLFPVHLEVHVSCKYTSPSRWCHLVCDQILNKRVEFPDEDYSDVIGSNTDSVAEWVSEEDGEGINFRDLDECEDNTG